jgi:hypothetical protein
MMDVHVSAEAEWWQNSAIVWSKFGGHGRNHFFGDSTDFYVSILPEI